MLSLFVCFGGAVDKMFSALDAGGLIKMASVHMIAVTKSIVDSLRIFQIAL
jgi:hypothetical protein